MASKYAYAAQKALRQIGKPAKIDEIWAVVEEDIGLEQNSQEPKQTLRNEIRKNCGTVNHVAQGNAYLMFTNPRRGFYGLTEWDGKTPLEPLEANPTNDVTSVTDSPVLSPLPEEIPDKDLYIEGASIKIRVNYYERDPRARQACINHWGTSCAVCHMSFGRKYGALGQGFIHIHHLIPLSGLGEDYAIYLISELRPVCPNCHAMLHKRIPQLQIEELQELLMPGSDGEIPH